MKEILLKVTKPNFYVVMGTCEIQVRCSKRLPALDESLEIFCAKIAFDTDGSKELFRDLFLSRMFSESRTITEKNGFLVTEDAS